MTLGLSNLRPPRLLLGRDATLAELADRAGNLGVTVVTGRPQIGKSRLLEALDERLTRDGFLVGRWESSGQEPDLMLRAVSRVYSHWLAASSWREQAESLRRRFGGEAPTLGLKLISRLLGKGSGIKVADELLSILWTADDALRSPIPSLKRLDYDQCRELITTLADVSGQPIALVLDGFDQSPDVSAEAKAIEMVLRHLDDWPPSFHIVIGARDSRGADDANDAVHRLTQWPACHELRLDAIDLASQPQARIRVIALIREWVPAATGHSDEELLALLDGYPGTLNRWLTERPKDAATLRQLADDAQRLRYRELETLLDGVLDDGGLRPCVTRLALLPEFTSDDIWQPFKEVVLQGVDDSSTLKLQSAGIFDQSVDYPSFGHTTRYRAAQNWLLDNDNYRARPYAKNEAQYLVVGLCGKIQRISDEEGMFAEALADLVPRLTRLPRMREYAATGYACLNLLERATSFEVSQWETPLVTLAKQHPEAASLAGALLLNAQFDTKRDRSGREGALVELRGLLRTYPSHVGLRTHLATALAQALLTAKSEGRLDDRNAFLDEIRTIVAADGSNADLRGLLALALINVMAVMAEEGDLVRRDALLEEVRAMATSDPNDVGINSELGRGLYLLVRDASKAGAPVWHSQALSNLRDFAKNHPRDDVLERLSRVLCEIIVAKDVSSPGELDEILDELRAMMNARPINEDIRRMLALALVEVHADAHPHGDPTRADAMKAELESLARSWPHDDVVGGALIQAQSL